MAKFIAATSKGFEGLLYEELEQLEIPRLKLLGSGVQFEGPWWQAYRVVHFSRIATRVLKPLMDFSAYNKDDIYNHVKKHEFTKYIHPHQTLRVDTQGRSHIFRDSRTVSLVTKDAIVDQFRESFGERPSVEKSQPDLPLLIKLNNESVSLSLDLVGRSLAHRGYREVSTEAPLREHMAAGLLQFLKWTPDQPLLDPMCGSGTFLIEAERRAQRRPNHPLNIDFSYKKFKSFAREDIDRITPEGEPPESPLELYASDQSLEALEAAQTNARKAHCKSIRFEQKSCLTVKAPAEKGMIICNPPYGIRMDDTTELVAFYEKWSDHLKSQFSGWTLGMISADLEFSQAMRMKAEKKMDFKNGDIDCRFLIYQIR